MKHTTGPWSATQTANLNFEIHETKLVELHRKGSSVDPMPICIMKSDEREGHDQKANAYLIAAAPDMLEALEAVIRQTEYQFSYGSIISNDSSGLIGMLPQLKQVVAKAKGSK